MTAKETNDGPLSDDEVNEILERLEKERKEIMRTLSSWDCAKDGAYQRIRSRQKQLKDLLRMRKQRLADEKESKERAELRWRKS